MFYHKPNLKIEQNQQLDESPHVSEMLGLEHKYEKFVFRFILNG